MASTCSVQLAVYDSLCPSQHLSPFENKIGGYPDFFSSCLLSSPPSCKSCDGPLAHLAQVYCPHDGSPYHRLLHVYCCCQIACWSKSESWLVLRSQQKDPSYGEVKQKEQLKPAAAACGSMANTRGTAREWCEDLDDWGGETGVGEGVWKSQDTGDPQKNVPTITDVECSQFEELMKSMTIQEASTLIETSTMANEAFLKETSVAEASNSLPIASKTLSPYQGPYYPASYITVVEEPEATSAEDEELLKKYTSDSSSFDLTTIGLAPQQKERKKESGHHKSGRKEKNGHSRDGGEMYEKGIAKHGDKMFQKFHKQLSKCPQQILRYSWRGKPLLISSHPAHVPPKKSALVCKECGATCVYEFQLMPTLVYTLHQSLAQVQFADGPKDSNLDLLLPKEKIVEFGTVLIYSCSSSCWKESPSNGTQFREEIIVVQPDLDTCTTVDKFIHQKF